MNAMAKIEKIRKAFRDKKWLSTSELVDMMREDNGKDFHKLINVISEYYTVKSKTGNMNDEDREFLEGFVTYQLIATSNDRGTLSICVNSVRDMVLELIQRDLEITITNLGVTIDKNNALTVESIVLITMIFLFNVEYTYKMPEGEKHYDA